MWSRSSAAALLLLGSLGVRAGDLALQRFESAEPHMGTLFRITVYAPDAAAAQSAFQAAFQRVAELDAALSDYNPQSELMQVCREAHQRPVKVGDDLFTVLEASQKLAVQTEGAFDVTLGPVIRLWREARQRRRPPDKAELEEALQRYGYHKLVLNPEDRTVFLKVSGMQLDVGGIGKGYAADEALQALRLRSITHALVAAGGDLAFGDPPPGKPGWRIGIDALGSPDSGFSRVLELSNAAVSTSGDAEQFVEMDGVRYSHIVNPRTGAGLTERISVTIVAQRAIISDSMATAVSVLGAEAGLAFAKEAGVAAFISTNGERGN